MVRQETDSTDRYLDLLKRVLTRYDVGDDYYPVKPGRSPLGRFAGPVGKILQRHGMQLVRVTPFNPALREQGRDHPAHAETMVGLRRLDNVRQAVETVLREDIPGDLLEAGVWRGGTVIFMRALLQVHGVADRLVWAADSFEGLPPPSPEHPADEGDEHHLNDFLSVGIEEVQRNFARFGLLDDQVRFLKGWFSDSLPSAPIERLAVLRLDGDMYGSTMDVLTSLYSKVSPGGFVIIDDYGAIPACRRAVHDFRDERGITEPMQEIDWTGVFWRTEQ